MPLISREISMEVLPSSPCRVDMLMLVLLVGRPLEGAKGLLGESALLSRGRLAGGGLLLAAPSLSSSASRVQR